MADTIERVTLYFPNTEDGTEVTFEVGKMGVTKIEELFYHPESYCTRYYYDVFEGDKKIASLHHFSEVRYVKA